MNSMMKKVTSWIDSNLLFFAPVQKITESPPLVAEQRNALWVVVVGAAVPERKTDDMT